MIDWYFFTLFGPRSKLCIGSNLNAQPGARFERGLVAWEKYGKNKEEKKNKAEIVFCLQNEEPIDFWKEIFGFNKKRFCICECEGKNF